LSIVVEMGREKSVNEVVQICQKKWNLKKTESLQVFSNKTLLRFDTRLEDLKRNQLGVVQLELILVETFG
jgi:hypothetical protein